LMDGDGRVWLRNAGRRRRKSLEQARWKGDRRSTADRQNGEGRRLVEQKDREDQVHGQSSRGWDWAREATGGHRASGRQLRPAGEPFRGQPTGRLAAERGPSIQGIRQVTNA